MKNYGLALKEIYYGFAKKLFISMFDKHKITKSGHINFLMLPEIQLYCIKMQFLFFFKANIK